jgi:hypothetical protein
VPDSFASRFFKRHPDVKARVMASPAFESWREGYKTVDVDGQPYSVVGGDMLRDPDEMALDWAREQGLVSQEQVDRLHAEEDRAGKGPSTK